jgi:hypothetical protein
MCIGNECSSVASGASQRAVLVLTLVQLPIRLKRSPTFLVEHSKEIADGYKPGEIVALVAQA